MSDRNKELEVAQRFGKKFANRCATVFDNSQLPLVGGEFTGQIAKARHLRPALIDSLVAIDPNEVDIDGLKPYVLAVYESLLLTSKFSKEESYINGLGGQDFQNLSQIGIDIANPETSSTVIRVVNGASTEKPLRVLSGALPALVLMENMTKKGLIPPQLQVIFANNISGRLNTLDKEQAELQAKRAAEVSQAYVREYFPDLADSTVFLIDTPLTKGSRLRDELLRVRRVLINEAGSEVMKTLAEKGIRNGAVRTYTFYGAAHPLIHDIQIEGSLKPILPEQPEIVEPGSIISIGGLQERFFYELRHKAKPYLGPDYNRLKTMQYFTRHHVPPYYMDKDGDVSLERALKNRMDRFLRDGIGKAATYDLDYLEGISASRGELTEFLERQARRLAI